MSSLGVKARLIGGLARSSCQHRHASKVTSRVSPLLLHSSGTFKVSCMNIWDFKQIHEVIQALIMILDTGDYAACKEDLYVQ